MIYQPSNKVFPRGDFNETIISQIDFQYTLDTIFDKSLYDLRFNLVRLIRVSNHRSNEETPLLVSQIVFFVRL